MRLKWILLSMMLVLLVATGLAGFWQQSMVEEDTLSTQCEASIPLTPDVAEAFITITTRAQSSSEALREAGRIIERINTSLEEYWNLTTRSSSIREDWAWEEKQRVFKGWIVRISLVLRAPAADAAQVLERSRNWENTSVSVHYTLSDAEKRHAEARVIEKTLRVCENRARTAARSVHRALGSVKELSVSVNTPWRVMPLVKGMMAESIMLPPPEEEQLSAHASITYRLV